MKLKQDMNEDKEILIQKQNDTDSAVSDVCDISGISNHSSDSDFAVTKKMLVENSDSEYEKYKDDDKELTRCTYRYGGKCKIEQYLLILS